MGRCEEPDSVGAPHDQRHDPGADQHKLPIRTLVAASVGNAVEWYDWTVFATFSIYFATQIFSAQNESAAFIGTFATYAVAFFFRPLGGMLLGRYADLHGRKQAMLLTIGLMAGGSFVISVLPTLRPGRLARPDPAAGRPHLAGHVAGRRGVERVGLPRGDRPRRASRPLLVVLLHLDRYGGAARLAARRPARQQPDRRPARELGLARPVLRRRAARPPGRVAAPRHGRDRAVRGEPGQGEGDQEPPAADAARAPAARSPS